MDRSQAEEIIARVSDGIAAELRVGHWKISIATGPTELGKGYGAQCVRQLPYDIAEITIDPDAYEDEASLVRCIRHELMHVVLAPFDMLHEALIQVLYGARRLQAEAIWRFVIEQCVLNLERMHDELTATPRKKGIPLMKPAARTAAPPKSTAPKAASKAPANPGMKRPKGGKKGGCK